MALSASKRLITITSLLMLVVCAVAIYGWINAAVSLDYARQGAKTERERGQLLAELLLASKQGVKRAEIEQFMKQNLDKDHILKEERDRLVVDSIVFRFDDAQLLTKIQFLGEE